MNIDIKSVGGEILAMTESQLRLFQLHSILSAERVILMEYMQSGRADIDFPDEIDRAHLQHQLLYLVELHDVVFARIQRFSNFARVVTGEATAAGTH